ncbi:hypothetical protein B7463_g413, partial [Scytalidium lignicola]
MHTVNSPSPEDILRHVTSIGIAKASLGWAELAVRAFLGGAFISLGGLINLMVVSGAEGLRASNPSIATLIASFTFPTGFFLITVTNTELATSSFFIMPFAALQRRITIKALLRNWTMGYIFNMCGALFFAGFLAWWTDTLGTAAEQAYTITQAEGRVSIKSYWSVNFLRGVGCNWLVGLATFATIATDDNLTKIYSIWIPIWAFAGLGYQHSIANFAGLWAVLTGCIFWFLYGREEESYTKPEAPPEASKVHSKRQQQSSPMISEATATEKLGGELQLDQADIV